MELTNTINKYADLLVEEEMNNNKEESNSQELTDELIKTSIEYAKAISTIGVEEQITILNQMKMKHDRLTKRLDMVKANKQKHNNEIVFEQGGIIDQSYSSFREKVYEIEIYLDKYKTMINSLEETIARRFNKKNIEEQEYQHSM